MKDFFPIETPYDSKDYKVMTSIVNMGIDSNLEGFTKSKFFKSPNFNNKFRFDFAVSELPILYRRMEELYKKSNDEDVLDFMNDIKASAKQPEAELAEMIDPNDPMDSNQTIDGFPTDTSDLNADGIDTAPAYSKFTAPVNQGIENYIDDDTVSQELASEGLDESHGDRYEQIVFLQGDEANEAMEILNNDGQDATLEYLKQWHHPGEHDGSNTLGAGSADKVFEKDGYTMNWNPYLPYIGLVYDTEKQMDEDSQVIRHQANQRGKIGEIPLGQHSPHTQIPK